jgi:hypothetical protein
MLNKKIITLIALALVIAGCASTNPIEKPQTQEALDLWIEAEEFIRYEENKAKTLWMYSTGSFALFALGLAVLSFWTSKRLSGLALMAGGVVGMASVWVFEAEWFPWVAGITVGLVALSALAFAYVGFYKAYFSSASKTEEAPKCTGDDSPPKS